MNLLCKLVESLKQNNQTKYPHRKILLWWNKSKGTILPSNIPISQELYPKKKIGPTEKQTGSCSQSTSTILPHDEDPAFFIHIQILAQKDIWGNLSPGFVMAKVRRLLQICFLKHSHKEHKGLVLSFSF